MPIIAAILMLFCPKARSTSLGVLFGWLVGIMAAIDTMTAARGFVLGFLLSALNPKNLLKGAAAGHAIGSGGLTVGESVLAITMVTISAASSVALPVIAFLAASATMVQPWKLRMWLVHNNATVMAWVSPAPASAICLMGLSSSCESSRKQLRPVPFSGH